MIDTNNPYFARVQLLVRVLPHIADTDCFALKGGTAINLFFRDLPRLSVDIDLVYVPIKSRDASLTEITVSLRKMGSRIKRFVPGVSVVEQADAGENITKLFVRQDGESIKIETSPVLRGLLFPPVRKTISPAVERLFGYAEASVVSFNELYAGKICAALDRQHPRDFFDMKILSENEGITDSLRNCFLVYLISSDRPISELLEPNKKELTEVFKTQFENMTTVQVSLNDLIKVRDELFLTILKNFTDDNRKFLVSFKKGTPEWNLLPLHGVDILPAVQWKLHNLNQMSRLSRKKAIEKLEEVLYK